LSFIFANENTNIIKSYIIKYSEFRIRNPPNYKFNVLMMWYFYYLLLYFLFLYPFFLAYSPLFNL
jgi:hypothetical protein